MDAGLGNTHTTWHAVAPAVSKLSRTCTYDRANLGSSDAAPKPRTSADVVADLRALLKAAAVAPPYVLVGHSFGGISARLFASDYPAEVAGIVLVDPTPTTFIDGECAMVSASLCAVLRQGWDPSNNPDGLDFVKSGEEIAQAGPLPGVPFVVLAGTNHQQAAITDPAIEKQIEEFWQQEEAKLAASVPGGKLDVVESGHDIQTLHPDAVISAVTSVIAGAHATP
jgi:pimeloyl-ACP methyl ester carboxylesterase